MNRGRSEIIAHVLAFCEQPRLKTQIMYSANITYKQFETYATLLSSRGLLVQDSQKYVTTEKGHRFVQAFNQLQSNLEDVPTAILARGFLFRRGKTRH
jgi:predicted transcriptional regulator